MSNGSFQVQIGPNVTGNAQGMVNSTSASFFVEVGSGSADQSYASYSTTAGSSWVPIPNNEQVEASGANMVQWKYSIPSGVNLKFVIGSV